MEDIKPHRFDIMRRWPEQPFVYEINACTWLDSLRRRYDRDSITLASVPSREWDAVAATGIDAVWLMGVWERSPASARIARTHEELREEFQRALPDRAPEDVLGSPYAVRRYAVDARLGGPEGLASAREALSRKSLRLLLDFVPNHVAIDHPWVSEHPEYLLRRSGAGLPHPRGRIEDSDGEDGAFFDAGGTLLAHGRDPNFPPWTDTAQLNAFDPALRRTLVETLLAIADQCDGVRCDMAMLPVNRIFASTWGPMAGPAPPVEFWRELIPGVRRAHPEFLFIAEAYWDMEWELLQSGFDFCYDKRLYDRLARGSAEDVRLHLRADLSYQKRLLRFIENHDEPRAAAVFNPRKECAAAVAIATLPGAKLFQEGQFEGRRTRTPVQLGRAPAEPADPVLETFYRKLLQTARKPAFRNGEWQLCEPEGWPDNDGYLRLVAWCGRWGENRALTVVNLSEARAQGRIRLPWDDLAGESWSLTDYFTGEVFERCGDAMREPGLYVDLDAHGFHLFGCAHSRFKAKKKRPDTA